MKRFLQYLEEATGEEIYKFYTDIPRDVYDQILFADPTKEINPDETVRKVGQYSKWMLNLYKKKHLKIEDLYKFTEDLTIFSKHKDKLPQSQRDINQYKTEPDLFAVIEPYKDVLTKTQEEEKHLKNAIIAYEDKDWQVVIPKSYEASCEWGSGSRWCTASGRTRDFYNRYSKTGNLYIINSKKNSKEKYQIHFESNSFMDINDRNAGEITPENIKQTFNEHVYNTLLKWFHKELENTKKIEGNGFILTYKITKEYSTYEEVEWYVVNEKENPLKLTKMNEEEWKYLSPNLKKTVREITVNEYKKLYPKSFQDKNYVIFSIPESARYSLQLISLDNTSLPTLRIPTNKNVDWSKITDDGIKFIMGNKLSNLKHAGGELFNPLTFTDKGIMFEDNLDKFIRSTSYWYEEDKEKKDFNEKLHKMYSGNERDIIEYLDINSKPIREIIVTFIEKFLPPKITDQEVFGHKLEISPLEFIHWVGNSSYGVPDAAVERLKAITQLSHKIFYTGIFGKISEKYAKLLIPELEAMIKDSMNAEEVKINHDIVSITIPYTNYRHILQLNFEEQVMRGKRTKKEVVLNVPDAEEFDHKKFGKVITELNDKKTKEIETEIIDILRTEFAKLYKAFGEYNENT